MKAPVLKTGVRETVPGVRIPPSPPYSLKCREIRLDFSRNCRKWAQFRYFRSKTGPEKAHCSMLKVSFGCFFSGGPGSSPVSTTATGECNAIRNRMGAEADLTFDRPNSIPREPFHLRFSFRSAQYSNDRLHMIKTDLRSDSIRRAFAQFRQSPGSVTRCFSSFPTSILNPALLPPASIHPIPLH